MTPAEERQQIAALFAAAGFDGLSLAVGDPCRHEWHADRRADGTVVVACRCGLEAEVPVGPG